MKKFIASWYIELFCALLTIACVTGVWMNALQQQVKQKGVTGFSIMQLELPCNEDSLRNLLNVIEEHRATPLVVQHLRVDFAFMPAVYIGIAFWLLLTGRTNGRRNMLFVLLAILQILPWVFDIIENITLLNAISSAAHQLTMSVQTFRAMVYAKFIIAAVGAVTALLSCIRKVFVNRAAVYLVIACI